MYTLLMYSYRTRLPPNDATNYTERPTGIGQLFTTLLFGGISSQPDPLVRLNILDISRTTALQHNKFLKAFEIRPHLRRNVS